MDGPILPPRKEAEPFSTKQHKPASFTKASDLDLAQGTTACRETDETMDRALSAASAGRPVDSPTREGVCGLLREKRKDQLPNWMERAAQSPLASFVGGLRRDFPAVQAAFSLPWSQGQVEGQIHRLKMLKRQMYGRAGFPLLRSRVLAAPSPKQKTQSVAA